MSKRKVTDFCTPEKENKRPKTSACSTPSSRVFRDEWKTGNAWLRYDPKSKLMFCDYCITSQRQNIFTKGCSILKKESVTKHVTNKGKTLFPLFHTVCEQQRLWRNCTDLIS